VWLGQWSVEINLDVVLFCQVKDLSLDQDVNVFKKLALLEFQLFDAIVDSLESLLHFKLKYFRALLESVFVPAQKVIGYCHMLVDASCVGDVIGLGDHLVELLLCLNPLSF